MIAGQWDLKQGGTEMLIDHCEKDHLYGKRKKWKV